MQRPITLLVLISFVLIYFETYAQESDYYVPDTIEIPSVSHCNRFTKRAAKKCSKLGERIHKSTENYLNKYQVMEDELLDKLCGFDERHAETLMRGANYSLRRLNEKQDRSKGVPVSIGLQELEAQESAAIQLEKMPLNVNGLTKGDSTKCGCAGLPDLLVAQKKLKVELKNAENVSTYIQERTEYLGNLKSQYPEMTTSILSLQRLNGYLNAQTKEYFALFSDKSAFENNLFASLKQLAYFTSQLGIQGPMKSPEPMDPKSLGLQSMEDAMNQLKEVAQSKNMDAKEALTQFSKFDKKKMSKYGSDTKKYILMSDSILTCSHELMDADSLKLKCADSISVKHEIIKRDSLNVQDSAVKPLNPLKTKRFVDRLSYNPNLQADPHTSLFPSTGTLALQVSYQVTTKMQIGVGGSFLVGIVGVSKSDFSKGSIHTFANGNSYRTYFNYNVCRNLFVQCNYEINYRQAKLAGTTYGFCLPFGDNQTSSSALAGVKLKTPSSKGSQKTFEVLYDFYHERSGQPALVVRMGIEILPKHAFKK